MMTLLPWFRRRPVNELNDNSEFTLPPLPRAQYNGSDQGTVATSYHGRDQETFLPCRSQFGGRYDYILDSFHCSSYNRAEVPKA